MMQLVGVGQHTMQLADFFERTQFSYWKKSTLNYNVYMALAVVLGFFAVDQLYLRSPISFLIKLAGNFLLFGIFYFYDVLEAVFNSSKVKLFGTSVPLVGQLGVGAGMFYEGLGSPSRDDLKREWNFVIYAALLFVTGLVGLDSWYLGDTMSCVLRAGSAISIIFLPVAFIWWLTQLWQFFFQTDKLLDMNWRFFGAPEPPYPVPPCPGILQQITIWVLETGITIAEQIPGLNLFVPWAKRVVAALRIAYGMAEEVVAVVTEGVPATVAAVQSLGEPALKGFSRDVAEARTGAATPEPQPQPEPKKQVGGSLQGSTTAVGAALLAAIAATSVSGAARFFGRMTQNGSQRSGERENDTPPVPGSI